MSKHRSWGGGEHIFIWIVFFFYLHINSHGDCAYCLWQMVPLQLGSLNPRWNRLAKGVDDGKDSREGEIFQGRTAIG